MHNNYIMKTTPFTNRHIALGAKMHEFAGFNMPIEYTGIIDEHLTVCTSVGVFDVSHMGEFWVEGPNALRFLQKITSNDVSALVPGKAQYTCFPNETGGIIDDLIVYQCEAAFRPLEGQRHPPGRGRGVVHDGDVFDHVGPHRLLGRGL